MRGPWRRPRPGLGAAQGPELAGQDVALVAPCLFLFALARHDVLRGAGDEILVSEPGGQTGELLVEPAQLVRQAAALLLHVDRAFERDNDLAAIADTAVAPPPAPPPHPHPLRGSIHGQALELRQSHDRVALARERRRAVATAGHDRRVQFRLWRDAILRPDRADLLDRRLDARELAVGSRILQRAAGGGASGRGEAVGGLGGGGGLAPAPRH